VTAAESSHPTAQVVLPAAAELDQAATQVVVHLAGLHLALAVLPFVLAPAPPLGLLPSLDVELAVPQIGSSGMMLLCNPAPLTLAAAAAAALASQVPGPGAAVARDPAPLQFH